MSQLQFTRRQYEIPFNTDDVIKAGSFESIVDFEIDRVFPMVYFNNINPTTERIRAIIYSDSTYGTAIYQSNWYTFADLTSIGPYGRWYIPIAFNNWNIKKGIQYFISFEIGNYTRSLSSYIAIESDVIDAIHDNDLSDSNIVTNSPYRYLVRGNAKPI